MKRVLEHKKLLSWFFMMMFFGAQVYIFLAANFGVNSVNVIVDEINAVEDVNTKTYVLVFEFAQYLKMHNFYFEVFGFNSAAILVALNFLLIAYIVRKWVFVLFEYIMNKAFKVSDKDNKFGDHKDLMHKMLSSARTPFVIFYFFLTLKLAFSILYNPNEVFGKLDLTLQVILVVTGAWFFWSFFEGSKEKLSRYVRKHLSDTPEENIIFTVFTLQAVIVIVAILWLTNILFPDWTKYVAAIGVAVGWMLKDNVLGYYIALRLIREEYIRNGDWISGKYNGIDYDGNIMNIGIFFVYIRLFDQKLLMIPVADFPKSFVANNSHRKNRQVKFDFYLPISSNPIDVETVISELRDYIENHPLVSKKLSFETEYQRLVGASETRFVHLVNIEHGYKINVYCYVNQDNWGLQRDLFQDLQLMAGKLALKHVRGLSIEAKHLQVQASEDMLNQKHPIIESSSSQ